MTKEEIHKALEIIKQPITVNKKIYYCFDNENYDKLLAVYENCLWFFEQINATVERLEKQNKFLMERENKLQLIETMFKNEPIDLKELSKLVRG